MYIHTCVGAAGAYDSVNIMWCVCTYIYIFVDESVACCKYPLERHTLGFPTSSSLAIMQLVIFER